MGEGIAFGSNEEEAWFAKPAKTEPVICIECSIIYMGLFDKYDDLLNECPECGDDTLCWIQVPISHIERCVKASEEALSKGTWKKYIKG